MGRKIGRAISDSFIKELKEGKWSDIIRTIKKDKDLTLFLRGSYATVYYKTLQILRINPKTNPQINGKYFGIDKNIVYIDIEKYNNNWSEYFDTAKKRLDNYIPVKMSKGQNKTEKEYQQKLVCENNLSNSDYQIIDVEYALNSILPAKKEDKQNKRIDALAIYKNKDNKLGLAFIELKVGNDAITGESGVRGHLISTLDFLDRLNKNKLKDTFIKDLNKYISHLNSLGLLNLSDNAQLSSDINPELIFAIADYKITKTENSLDKQIKLIANDYPDGTPYNVLFTDFNFGNNNMKLFRSKMIPLQHILERIKEIRGI